MRFKKPNKDEESKYWGVLNRRNIRCVVLGNYKYDTWYGNGAYFNLADTAHSHLGYEFSNIIATQPKARKKTPVEETDCYWLDTLYVCEYCFKYSSKSSETNIHRRSCSNKFPKPIIGDLVYYDDYIIRQVRGFKHRLFCQNLALFGKLFLDDKSVFYNIDHYNFYVIYGKDSKTQDYLPMGFFSKEVVSWENDNNLACICIFPPYQRKGLGWLLIEFLYALAKATPGQLISGPEFPLSPYGKMSYYRFWSVKLAFLINESLSLKKSCTASELSVLSGFRKEDILLTLEYMKLLTQDKDKVKLMLGNLPIFCEQNGINPNNSKNLLNDEKLLI